jgi:hypothetical protein
MAATIFEGGIFISTNSGKIWTWTGSSAPPSYWGGIAFSADGANMVAAVGPEAKGGIYIRKSIVMPQLNIAHSTTNLLLSWIIPSTNFVMQQSSNLISWSTVTNTPTLNLTNLQNQVTLALSNKSGFYRLKTP